MIKHVGLTRKIPVSIAPSSSAQVSLADRSQFPLFMQTAAALFGFLLLISCFSWVSTPTFKSQASSAQTSALPRPIN